MPGRLRRVGDGLDAGNDPDQAALPATVRHDAFQPVDVVEVVDDDEPESVLDRQLELLVGLGVAVHDQSVGIGARLDRGQYLAAARHVEVETFFDHHPLNRGARERFRRERHVGCAASGCGTR